MAISKNTQANIDDSNPTAYPNGQVKDDSGTGDGFPLIQVTMSDMYEFFDKLMRLAGLTFNSDFDNETNGYQFIQACAALASKSDFVLPLTIVGSVIQIPTALQILQLNEKLICLAGFNQSTETTIKGTGPTALNVTITSSFKNGDYILLTRTSGGVKLVRIATADNINQLVSDNAYLKAAANTDEDTGTSVAKATTPASGKYIFTKRVTDPTAAAPYFATHTTPGIMSAADKTALDGFTTPIKNTGWFNGLDPGSSGQIGTSLGSSGNVVSAIVTAADVDSSTVRVTVTNTMASINFFVSMFIESQGTVTADNDILCPVFIPISTSVFDMNIAQAPGTTSVQSLRIHFQVVQIS